MRQKNEGSPSHVHHLHHNLHLFEFSLEILTSALHPSACRLPMSLEWYNTCLGRAKLTQHGECYLVGRRATATAATAAAAATAVAPTAVTTVTAAATAAAAVAAAFGVIHLVRLGRHMQCKWAAAASTTRAFSLGHLWSIKCCHQFRVVQSKRRGQSGCCLCDVGSQ